MHSAGHCTLILPFETSLDRWTDHAARTGKCGLPAGSACEPSVPEFPLTLVIRGRGREPRISSYVAHTRTRVGTDQAKFPPASVRRLGYDVVGTLTRHKRGGGPALHACLGPSRLRSARLSQGETPVPTKNKSVITGPGPSLDGPCRTHRKVRHASEIGLQAVRPRIPAHAGHTRPGPRAAYSSCVAHTRTGGDSSLGASQQNILC